MRKILMILAVLMFASQVLANVTVSAVQDGSNKAKVWIHYSASGETDLIRAFALKLTVDNGKKITAISNYKTDGVSSSGSPGYGIYMGSIQIDGNGDVTDYNNPVAPSDAPDNPPQLGSDSIIIELGSLYKDGPNAPTNDGNLCAVTLDLVPDSNCKLCITEDSLRGGIVMEDTNGPEGTITLGCTNIVYPPPPPPECFNSGHADYTKWVGVGKPSCWCFKWQCNGDGNGRKDGDPSTGYYYVEYKDLSLVLNSWKAVETATNFNICADMNRQKDGDPSTGYYRVEYKDLSKVLNAWKKATSQLNTVTCGGTIVLN